MPPLQQHIQLSAAERRRHVPKRGLRTQQPVLGRCLSASLCTSLPPCRHAEMPLQHAQPHCDLRGDAKLHPLCVANRALASHAPSRQRAARGRLSPEIPVFNTNPTHEPARGFLQGLTLPWLAPAFCTSKAYAVVVSRALLEEQILPLPSP